MTLPEGESVNAGPYISAYGDRPPDFRHLQVRLVSGDAKRLKALADKRDLSIQDVLVEAINLLLADWGKQPVGNPGTTRKEKGMTIRSGRS